MPSGLQAADEVAGELIGVAPRGIDPAADFPSGTPDKAGDVLVVGSGMAGLCAALCAAAGGARVTLLEISQEIGGLTRLSSGLVNFVDPSRQEPLGINDSVRRHFDQTIAFGQKRADASLVRVLCGEAEQAARWLQEQGVKFSSHVYQRSRTLFPRGHLPLQNAGAGIVDVLAATAVARGVKFCLQHEAIKFERAADGGFNVVVNNLSTGRADTIHTKALILACGGFSSDRKLLVSQDRRLGNVSVSATLPAVARMIRCILDMGVAVSGMGFVQKEVTLPNGDPLPAVFRNPASYIALDLQGKRFMREDLPYNEWLEEVINKAGGEAVLLAQGRGQRLAAYWTVTSNLDSLGHDVGLNAQVIRQALDEYNTAVQRKADPFGKSSRSMTAPITGPEIMGARVQVRVLTTLGGIRITSKAEVLDRKGNVIHGLFACGDVTGGVHGMYALNGNLLLSALVFGRRAGMNAAGSLL